MAKCPIHNCDCQYRSLNPLLFDGAYDEDAIDSPNIQELSDDRILLGKNAFKNARDSPNRLLLSPLLSKDQDTRSLKSVGPKGTSKSQGTIPTWLIGSYYHLAPSIFDFSHQLHTNLSWFGSAQVTTYTRSFAHWFDPLPILHHVEFGSDGSIFYDAKFVGQGAISEWRDAVGGIPVSRHNPIAQSLYEKPSQSLADRINDWIASFGERLRCIAHLGHGRRNPLSISPDCASFGTCIIGDFPMGAYRGTEGRLVIHQEGQSLALQVDPLTLLSRHLFSYVGLNPAFKGTPAPIPKFDPYSGEMIQVLCDFKLPLSSYRVVSIPYESSGGGELVENDGGGRSSGDGSRGATESVGMVVAKFMASPSLIRSFAITPNYVIVVIFPFTFTSSLPSYRYQKSLQLGLYNNLKFNPTQDTLFYIISRARRHLVAVYRSEAAFAFHIVNAFEADNGNSIFVDIAAYEDESITKYLSLDNLRFPDCNFPSASPNDDSKLMFKTLPSNPIRRYSIRCISEESARLDGAAGQLPFFPLAPYHYLTDFGVELVSIAPTDVGHPYRHVYGVAIRRSDRGKAGMLWNAIVKCDLIAPTTKSYEWSQEGCFPSHPVFVPRKRNRSVGELFGRTLISTNVEGNDGIGTKVPETPVSLSHTTSANMPHQQPSLSSSSSSSPLPQHRQPVGMSTTGTGITTTPLEASNNPMVALSSRDGAKESDDGVLITTVFDVRKQKSFISILDAHDLHEIARLLLPHPVPPSFSVGCWSWAARALLADLPGFTTA